MATLLVMLILLGLAGVGVAFVVYARKHPSVLTSLDREQQEQEARQEAAREKRNERLARVGKAAGQIAWEVARRRLGL